jgi:hypothetical protein
LARDLLRLADGGEGREHLVGDAVAHGAPLAALRERVQLLLQWTPAVHLEDRPIRGVDA